MEFLTKLKETSESKRFKENYERDFSIVGSYEDYGYRKHNLIKINEEVSLSIQASYGHYCTPRKTVAIDQYETMEFAIVTASGLVAAAEVSNNKKLIEKLETYFDGQVYGYVPVEMIEELYQDLMTRNAS